MNAPKTYAFLVLTVFSLLAPVFVWAFSPNTVVPESPREPITLDEVPAGQEWLGQLNDFPQSFEIAAAEPFILHLTLAQSERAEFVPLQLLVVRENDRNGGVTEVLRVTGARDKWARYATYAFGLPLISLPSVSERLEPGVYRVEVSAPDNQGSYFLYLGSNPPPHWEWIGPADVAMVLAHFDASVFRVFLSLYVLVPLVLVVLGYGYWRRYNQHNHV